MAAPAAYASSRARGWVLTIEPQRELKKKKKKKKNLEMLVFWESGQLCPRYQKEQAPRHWNNLGLVRATDSNK